MTIVHISDTHGRHGQLGELPSADVIVHSGDITENGTEEEALDFMNWFCELPYSYKIFIAGNHDLCLHNAVIDNLDTTCHFLYDNEIEIDGARFYGVPYFAESPVVTAGSYRQIPDGIDVLITHQPPYGIHDLVGESHWGSEDLYLRVQNLKPSLHLFGHAHSANGMTEASVKTSTTFSNASFFDDGFGLVFGPRVLKI